MILPSIKYRFVATNVIMSSYTRDDRRSSSSTVSEVKSDELAKMIEGVNEGDPLKSIPDPRITSNLKSSIKSSPSNGQRKVQFTQNKHSKDFDFDLDDPLGDLDLSNCDIADDDDKKREMNANQRDMKSNKDRPLSAQSLKVKSNTYKPLSPLKVIDNITTNAETNLKGAENNSPKMLPSDSPNFPKLIPRRTSLQPNFKQHEDDDLFSLDGKASPKRDFSPARGQAARRNSSFMSDLFGHKKLDLKPESRGDFILEEKYKQPVVSSTISENGSDLTDVGTPIRNAGEKDATSPPKNTFGRRGRRGTAPTLNLQRGPEISGIKR